MKYIRWFGEISLSDVSLVGGKCASLGEMYQQLTPLGVCVPNGFAVASTAYDNMVSEKNVPLKLHNLLKQLDNNSSKNISLLSKIGLECRNLILNLEMPKQIQSQISNAWEILAQEHAQNEPCIPLSVAVRSSATCEDMPNASFAGQHDSYLNIQSLEELLSAIQKCQASLFTNRAISYRIDQGIEHEKLSMSVAVMKMVRSDVGCSGVAFTIDTESGHEDMLFMTGSYGLGENVVQGLVDVDEWYVHKPTFKIGYRSVLTKRLGQKQVKMIYVDEVSNHANSAHQGVRTQNMETNEYEQSHYCLTDFEVMQLSAACIAIENHYNQNVSYDSAGGGGTAKKFVQAMDIEWAKDGFDNKMYIVQARPETVKSKRDSHLVIEEYSMVQNESTPIEASSNASQDVMKVLVRGRSVGEGVAYGKVRVLSQDNPLVDNMTQFKQGEVLVVESTTPDWEPILKKASAIITNRGGRTCHAAIVARELGIPAVVGAEHATEILSHVENSEEEAVTVCCCQGSEGLVFANKIPFEKSFIDLKQMKFPVKTKIMLNIGNPALAFHAALIPCDGVGLVRLEFIMNEHIKIHPMACYYHDILKQIKSNQHQCHHEHYRYQQYQASDVALDSEEDEGLFASIEELSQGFKTSCDYFVSKMAQGVGVIAAAFYPRPVIVRLSDLKSNEYFSLMGGDRFEDLHEENPMLGFRGASRYTHNRYKPAFALECEALRYVRNNIGCKNVIVMVPFCRTLPEAKAVLALLEANDLKRGTDGLQIFMMCEIPNNVILIDEFSQLFDGFSIGSNDLTQLTLGIDRESAILASSFDEADPGMLKMFKLAIDGAHRHFKPVGICGEAPSNSIEMAKFLVSNGIDSISLSTTKQVLKTGVVIAELEEELQIHEGGATEPEMGRGMMPFPLSLSF